MKALISPNEPVETGYRVAEVAQDSFEIAPPLFWVDCTDDVVADQFWYDPTDQIIKSVPLPPEPENQPISQGAQTL